MKRFALIAITLIVSSVSHAQSEVSMGKIPVYTFAMDSLYYEGRGKQLSAVGTEHMADLYMTNMGGANYYKIVIGGETFAVMKDSYGLGVSYGYCWLYKDGKYKQLTGLTYKAGQYYLTLPFGQQNASTTNPNQTSSSTTSIEKQKPALDWQPANISEVEVAFSVEKPQLKRIVCTAEQFLNIRVKSFTSLV